MNGARIGVDVGGTFTDVVVISGDDVTTTKVPTTAEQSDGVVSGIDAARARDRVALLAHGTTVATNALLERRGVRTALVTTRGFRDVIEIGRQNRASLYDLARRRPEPLVPRPLRFEVTGRMGPDGELEPLDEGDVVTAGDAIAAAGVEAVAVCFLFGYLHPEHERRAGNILRTRLPGVHVSLSSDVLPEFREYERTSTTVCNAYLGPLVERYLERLVARARGRSLPAPLVMQSSGGVLPAEQARALAAGCVLSGPAAGVVGAAHVAAASGSPDVLTFDMGGTSTDVAAVIDGEARATTESIVGGVPIKLPSVDLHTVGAGGGSIAWVDAGGALRVGPRSAGAAPGPACYGRGGDEPTVTDADLYLGYLAHGAVLGGEVRLDRRRSVDVIERLARRLSLTPDETAAGIARVAEAEMMRALKVISVERGLDPRDFALVAFGGAGPLHACALAEQLDMTRVLVPLASGVLSALGLALAELRRDYVHPLLADIDEVVEADVEHAFGTLEKRGADDLPGASFTRRIDCRYRGQAFEITVLAGGAVEAGRAFHDAHDERYGYRMEDEPVQIVNVRVTAVLPTGDAPVPGRRPGTGGPPTETRACIDGRWLTVPLFVRTALAAGDAVGGPAIVTFPEATCLVRPRWTGRVDEHDTLVLERT